MAPRLPKIPAKVAEPSTDAIYNAYPNQGPGFYRYVERDSRRRNYDLGRPRWSANSLAAIEPSEALQPPDLSPDKAKSPARKAGLFLIAQAAALSTASKSPRALAFKGESSPMGMRIRKLSRVVQAPIQRGIDIEKQKGFQ